MHVGSYKSRRSEHLNSRHTVLQQRVHIPKRASADVDDDFSGKVAARSSSHTLPLVQRHGPELTSGPSASNSSLGQVKSVQSESSQKVGAVLDKIAASTAGKLCHCIPVDNDVLDAVCMQVLRPT